MPPKKLNFPWPSDIGRRCPNDFSPTESSSYNVQSGNLARKSVTKEKVSSRVLLRPRCNLQQVAETDGIVCWSSLSSVEAKLSEALL